MPKIHLLPLEQESQIAFMQHRLSFRLN